MLTNDKPAETLYTLKLTLRVVDSPYPTDPKYEHVIYTTWEKIPLEWRLLLKSSRPIS